LNGSDTTLGGSIIMPVSRHGCCATLRERQ
jgi:hypothetical protein